MSLSLRKKTKGQHLGFLVSLEALNAGRVFQTAISYLKTFRYADILLSWRFEKTFTKGSRKSSPAKGERCMCPQFWTKELKQASYLEDLRSKFLPKKQKTFLFAKKLAKTTQGEFHPKDYIVLTAWESQFSSVSNQQKQLQPLMKFAEKREFPDFFGKNLSCNSRNNNEVSFDTQFCPLASNQLVRHIVKATKAFASLQKEKVQTKHQFSVFSRENFTRIWSKKTKKLRYFFIGKIIFFASSLRYHR